MLLMGICQKGSAGLWASPSPPIMTSYKSDLPSALFHTAPSQRQNSPPNIINPPSFSFQISFKASLITTLQPRQMLPQRVRPECRGPGESVGPGRACVQRKGGRKAGFHSGRG